MDALLVTGGLSIPATDLSWTAVPSSGPGGQNVNKVASKVALRLDLEGTGALSDEVKARLRGLARRRLDAEGGLVVVSQRTRDQLQNLMDARDKLAALVRSALEAPRRRVPTRPTRASVRRRVEAKRRQGAAKRGRRGGDGDEERS